MNRTYLVVILAAGAVAVGGGWYHFHASAEPVQVATAEVASGDVVQNVACTGTLDAVTTIDVGSQVSGTISTIPVDFNSLVRKGDDHQLRSQISVGRADGMMTMEQSLAELVKTNRIARDTAFAHCFRSDDLQRYLV